LENRKQAKQTAMDQDADSAVPVAQPSDEIVVLSEVLEAEKEYVLQLLPCAMSPV
jgi:hypothetical protein